MNAVRYSGVAQVRKYRKTAESCIMLSDEAFADLLAKHHRPRTLKEALKQSARSEPANENRPQKKRGS